MRKFITAALVFLTCVVTTVGRLLPNWPYEKLFSEADVVVMAYPVSTVDTKDVFAHVGNKPEDYISMNTDFQIRW